MGGWWRLLRILRVTKLGKQSLCVMWVWGKKVLDYSRPPDAPSVSIFDGCSYGTPIGVDRLHMISLCRKSCLQYELLLGLLFNYIPHLWKSFYPLVVSWFSVLLGCSNLWGWMLWSAKQCQRKFIRERSKWFDPHRFVDLISCID